VEEALRGATLVTAVSSAHARLLRAAHGVDARFVPNAVDPERFRPNTEGAARMRQELNLGPGPIVGMFGELKRKRGLEHLAGSRLVGDRARLLLVGEVRAEVRALVPPHAVLLPWVDDDDDALTALYTLCDAVLHPSTDDGMPNVVLEAMACARPVVVTRAGGLADLVRDGVNGFVVGERSLDEAIARALEDPSVGERARSAVPRPEEEARAYAACFAEAMRRYAARSASA
jgi:glycosyltransferase involved in cell wall biosynthesis